MSCRGLNYEGTLSSAQTGNVRKVVVTVQIFAEGKLRARGEVIAAPIPQAMLPPGHLKD
jgi:hypothetical protein